MAPILHQALSLSFSSRTTRCAVYVEASRYLHEHAVATVLMLAMSMLMLPALMVVVVVMVVVAPRGEAS